MQSAAWRSYPLTLTELTGPPAEQGLVGVEAGPRPGRGVRTMAGISEGDDRNGSVSAANVCLVTNLSEDSASPPFFCVLHLLDPLTRNNP
ncbi:unnamed protein product [Gadus morhua 'NCC']